MAAGAILKAIQTHDPRSRYVRQKPTFIFADHAPVNSGKVCFDGGSAAFARRQTTGKATHECHR
jgi:hypothetical protein